MVTLKKKGGLIIKSISAFIKVEILYCNQIPFFLWINKKKLYFYGVT